MAETSFYINDIERQKLFNFLALDGALLIPNMMYPTAEFETVNNPKEFIEIIENKTVGFYIIHESFALQKLILSQNRYFEIPTFSIDQRYGGPYISLSLYRGFADDAKVKMKCTALHHYAQYINIYNNNEEFKASDDLKDYYKKIIKFIKSISKIVNIDGKKYWIGKEAIKEMNFM